MGPYDKRTTGISEDNSKRIRDNLLRWQRSSNVDKSLDRNWPLTLYQLNLSGWRLAAGMGSTVGEVAALAVDTIAQIVKGAGAGPVRPHLQLLVGSLLESLSTLEVRNTMR